MHQGFKVAQREQQKLDTSIFLRGSNGGGYMLHVPSENPQLKEHPQHFSTHYTNVKRNIIQTTACMHKSVVFKQQRNINADKRFLKTY